MAKIPYVPAQIEIEYKDEPRGGSLKTKLPFGLCKKYGIDLPDDATPRDAWNALKGIGISVKDEYKKAFGDKDKDKNDNEPKPDEKTIEARRDKIFGNRGDQQHFIYQGAFNEQYCKEQFDQGDDMHKEIILSTLENSGITYRMSTRDQCFSATGRVELTVNPNYGGEDNSYTKGEVFYHESFHAVDGAYASYWGGMLSHTYTDENGKSLYDVLKSEKRGFAGKIPEIEKMRNDERDNMMIADGIDAKKIESDWDKVKANLSKFSYGSPEYNSYKDSENFKTAYQNYRDLSRSQIIYNRKLNKKYGFLSDIMSQYNSSMGMGHSMSYWKKDKYNSSSEFFAEVGACGATNKEALEVVRKYFPTSVEYAEKLIRGIHSGTIKKTR